MRDKNTIIKICLQNIIRADNIHNDAFKKLVDINSIEEPVKLWDGGIISYRTVLSRSSKSHIFQSLVQLEELQIIKFMHILFRSTQNSVQTFEATCDATTLLKKILPLLIITKPELAVKILPIAFNYHFNPHVFRLIAHSIQSYSEERTGNKISDNLRKFYNSSRFIKKVIREKQVKNKEKKVKNIERYIKAILTSKICLNVYESASNIIEELKLYQHNVTVYLIKTLFYGPIENYKLSVIPIVSIICSLEDSRARDEMLADVLIHPAKLASILQLPVLPNADKYVYIDAIRSIMQRNKLNFYDTLYILRAESKNYKLAPTAAIKFYSKPIIRRLTLLGDLITNQRKPNKVPAYKNVIFNSIYNVATSQYLTLSEAAQLREVKIRR